jgi:hypothetical protein
VVWREGGIELTTCPVRWVTPEAMEVLGWFDRTHEVTGGYGVAWWRLRDLPGAGGVDEQDARLMAGLEFVRHMENAEIEEARAKRAKERGDQRKDRRRRG